ncbi:MAG: tyrosine-type recombinase/integrase [Gallionella sp.]|nr:tyrosine-type recombinase/integrase [Gallionella sp.]
MAHIERRRQLWYAVLEVPTGVRSLFDGKRRMVKSLGTPDKREAEILAAPLVASWKAQFRQAMGITNPVHLEALLWKRELDSKANDPDQLQIAEEFLTDKARELVKTKGTEAAQEFHGIATGTRTQSNAHYEAWKAQLGHLKPKTIDQMVKDVSMMLGKFSSLESINKKAVKGWLEELEKEGKKSASLERIVSFCRNYWKYLQSQDVVPIDIDPFFGVINLTKNKKASTAGSWIPFKPSDVVTLWKKAGEKQDSQLQSLIMLGAYTGARIAELCAIKVADVSDSSFHIIEAKTGAGVREVPIHSSIKELVGKLKAESVDGYLLSGLTFNKYGDRSNAIGKRFGILKTDLKYSSGHVFHSIRKTLTTLLENAGVSENLAADIVGHEKPRITYGLYSGGATLKVKQAALERVKYPF